MTDIVNTAPDPVVPAPWARFGDDAAIAIRDVRVICTAPDGIRLVVVKVETTEPGLFGLGCATFTQRPLAVKTAVEEYLRSFLIGRSVHDIEDIWQAVFVSSYWRGGPVLNNALSGVDIALWDIKGKIAKLPVYQLFGGKCREAASLYAHASGGDIDAVEENARALMADGFRHVRCQVAVPGSATYGAHTNQDRRAGRSYATHLQPGDARWNPAAYGRIVPRLFDAMRQRLGEEVEFLHDIHERLHPMSAIRLAQDLEPYRLFFLEDPFAPEDNGYFPLLRQQSSIPIAMGELFVNQAEYVPLVRDRLIDFIRIHISDIGGLTPARKLGAFAEFFNVRTAWHGPGDVSPVGHAANLALDLSQPNFGIQEAHLFSDRLREVFPGCPEIRDGSLWSNDHPGLGIDIDEEKAARYPFPEHPLNGGWPDIRLRDGTIVRP
ncbi:MAG: Starvation sensing protein RspA [uncultured Thermomicrobiales bacterium]|uniref:Starvation sensing protein RspA n=1 Tax=uncultured Thermomicrobiales bacterium TaxID=1645740 RepID=A0A6J4UXK9_9BACT|nr:MAG: Starvation sensing protein RspA [uncultured Thermomicrobiales bacterium]